MNEPDPLKCVVDIQDREAKKCLIALASHRAMSPLRQALPRHSASRQARLAPPNSRCGLLNCRIRTQQNHYLCHHLPSRAPCVSREGRQAIPRFSASRQVGTPELTLRALEDKRANLFQQKRRGPKPAPKWFNRCQRALCKACNCFDTGKVDTRFLGCC